MPKKAAVVADPKNRMRLVKSLVLLERSIFVEKLSPNECVPCSLSFSLRVFLVLPTPHSMSNLFLRVESV
jgi:hypothetical protein